MVAVQHIFNNVDIQNAPFHHAIPAASTVEVPCDWASNFQPMGQCAAIVPQENQRALMVDHPFHTLLAAQLWEHWRMMPLSTELLKATVVAIHSVNSIAVNHRVLHVGSPAVCPFLLRKVATDCIGL